MALIPLEEPTLKRAAPKGFAPFALGFRPFYLLAASFAALAIPAWVAMLGGLFAPPMPSMWWHAHEMLFGFAVAVIVGFLFTAGRNWTGLPTPTGARLAALAGVWLAGRLAMAFGSGPWAAAVDLAFLPLAAFALARVLVKARSTRNYFLPALLVLLTLGNLAFHLAQLGLVTWDPLQAVHFGLALVVVIETAIGGRVIPMFTFNALRGIWQWRNPRLDAAAIGTTAAALVLWALQWVPVLAGGLALLAAVLQTVRCVGWNPRAALARPLLWILHLGHLWIPLGLALVAASQWGWVARSAAVHAFAIGATGGLILGMITRTALGHTGRMLEAGKLESWAYGAVLAAAAARVITLLALPTLAWGGVLIAALAWALAFCLYLVRYVPILLRPRIDGKEG